MENYDPKLIEPKWQEFWLKEGIYKNYEKSKKFYALDMFPYISGSGIHVGHPKGYIATDVVSRFKMLQGYSVLHPMGWDAFGLPAENYAIKNKINPNIFVKENIIRFKKQLEMFGFTYDWDREFSTTDPNYYKWTQWIFLKLFEKGLAYESNEPVNWCSSCKTVLANEDLEKGLCERCGTQVVQKKMRQWVLKMTDYADRLLYDLDTEGLDWEEQILEQQRNWIGRSEGAEIEFQISNSEFKIKVYTTRVDTIFGCTYCVIAPEHETVQKLKNKIENWDEVEKYLIESQNKTELERMELKDKTGVELKGIKLINPFNGESVPLFAADYVLAHYGTGAVMAVPAHDERDFEFAKKYNLPIKNVIGPCFCQQTEPGKIKEKEPFEERDAVLAIVKHQDKDEYLGLKWKQVDWKTFITGGPEEGQTAEEAARMEVLEETGYKNLKLIKELPMVHSKFYHVPKKLNRLAHFRVFYFELENDEHQEISEIDKKRHEVVWVTKEKVETFLTPESQIYTWQTLLGKEKPYVDDGVLANSDKYSSMTSEEAREKMTEWLEKEKIGEKKINYKMRDWVFSRQRYWGEPIPIVHCEKCGAVAISEKELPLKLPEVENYEPTGTEEGPLANITEWVNTTCPKCGGPGKRETNTMPQWAGSSWYYLRYIDPKNNEALVEKNKEKDWMPVDLYVGGAEHATRHLLYARFWHKFLYDIKVVSTKEPFKKLVHVGLVDGEDGRKMSKRWGNVVNPDDVINEFGVDSLRLYEMFMGPFSQNIAWSTDGVKGVRRFLEKVWKLQKKVIDQVVENKKLESLLHKTIKKVTEDIKNFRFNTAISAMMILVNELEKGKNILSTNYKLLITILSPFAPHIAEELWEKLGHKDSIFLQSWPEYDPELIRDEKITLVLQINGKVRDSIEVDAGISEKEAKELAMQSEKIKTWVSGKEIKKVIFVKGKLINIVI
ncbi:MAG: class I tRNA ligase family protein [Parcubacteria group bacterium]|jgi:leucyl-tRNA synthetase